MTLREWWARLRGSVFGGHREADLAQELEFHREMLESQHRERGLDASAARRAAAIELGGVAQHTEAWRDQKGLPFLDALAQDLRYGIRMMRRTPGFTVAALLTLALGIGGNTAIFTVVDAVLLRPLPYPEPDRLVTVGDRNPEGFSGNVGFTTVLDWREQSRSFEALAMMRGWGPTLFVHGEAEQVPAVRVSWNYFRMMGIAPALGRDFSEDDDRPDHWRVLILSDGLWRRRFSADPSVIGRTVTMNDREYRVIGIMPPSFEPLDAQSYYAPGAEMWAPIGYDRNGDSACRSCQHLRAFGRLTRGVSLADATAEMNALRERMRREHPTDYREGTIAIVPLRNALTGPIRTALFVLLGAIGFVLLIACANVANLLLARSVTRQRELAMRTVLGAGRARIVRQLLTESVLLSALGAAGGILLAAIAVPVLTAFTPVHLPRLDRVAIDSRVLLFAVGLAIITAIAFGLLPAWRGAAAARERLAIDSRGSIGGRSRARSALVIADLALALVLLAGAGLMLRTAAALIRTSPGFNPERILAVNFSLVGNAYAEDSRVYVFQQQVMDQLRALPNVESVAIAGQIPFGGNYDCRGFHVDGRMKSNDADDPCIERYSVSPRYHELMQIPLLSGRHLSAADATTSQPVALISRATARVVFGNDNPIGARFRLGSARTGVWRTIVGVVDDVHHQDVTTPPTAAIYLPQSQFTDSFLVALIKVRAGDPLTVAGAAREVFRALDPTVPVFGIETLPSLVAAASAQRTFVMKLLSAFAVIATLLAAIGLYGVVSYGVALRTREVGVRMALGARPADVLRLMLVSGLRLVVVGLAVGLAGAAVSTRFLGSLVFGVSPVDPLTFGGAAIALVTVALLAHWIPVRRALRIDPAIALRAE